MLKSSIYIFFTAHIPYLYYIETFLTTKKLPHHSQNYVFHITMYCHMAIFCKKRGFPIRFRVLPSTFTLKWYYLCKRKGLQRRLKRTKTHLLRQKILCKRWNTLHKYQLLGHTLNFGPRNGYYGHYPSR